MFCAVFLAGCGGDGIDDHPSAPAQQTERASAASAVQPQGGPVWIVLDGQGPAGTARVMQFIAFPFGNASDLTPYYRTSFEYAEYIVSQFDERRIPINIVSCGGSDAGQGVPANMATFTLVLDVRQEDLPLAKNLGFVELASRDRPLSVFTEAVCSLNRREFSVEQRIQGLASRAYGRWFNGLVTVTGSYQQFSYRYYSGSGNFLGLVGDDVYVHNGQNWNFERVGKVKDFIPYIDGIPGTVPKAVPGQ